MSWLRPEAVALIGRWREVAAATATACVGIWLLAQGGYAGGLIGAALLVAATAWGIVALRRVKFRLGIDAPGVVEVDEGQVGYFGPNFGGFVATAELAELSLIRFHGARQWRLRQTDGQVLTIPLTARGAEALFDAFATLPGIDMGHVSGALDRQGDAQIVWRRTAPPALT